jgi:hypothetical protein
MDTAAVDVHLQVGRAGLQHGALQPGA